MRGSRSLVSAGGLALMLLAVGVAMVPGAGAADVLRERGVLELIKSFKGIEDIKQNHRDILRDYENRALTYVKVLNAQKNSSKLIN